MPLSDPGVDDSRLAAALAAIDAANVEDPVRVEVDGVRRSKELVHAERMSHWISVLDTSPSDAQLLAARAAHLRRWELPRAQYPDGRSGYLRWRREQKQRHGAAVAEVLSRLGYGQATIDRTVAIVAKEHLGTDAHVQAHEDALCLTFLELEFDGLAARLGDERTIDVLRRTVRKMSEAALTLAAGIDLSAHGGSLLARALALESSADEPRGS